MPKPAPANADGTGNAPGALSGPRIISVGGGKGGVGKSVVAANLAVAMAEGKRRVVLVDADLGAANQHTLFGVDRTGPGLHGFFEHQVERLEDALVPTALTNLALIPGSGAVVGAANINHGQKGRLLRHIARLPADVVIVDVGAGSAYNALDLFLLAHQRVVVATPQLTSIQNAYGFLKGAVWRELRRVAAAHNAVELVDGGGHGETERVVQLLERAVQHSERLATDLQTALIAFGASLIGNHVFQPAEARAFQALSHMARDFLDLTLPVLGSIKASRRVHDSVNRRRPFLLDGAFDETGMSFRNFALRLLQEPLMAPPLPRADEPADEPTDVPVVEVANGSVSAQLS